MGRCDQRRKIHERIFTPNLAGRSGCGGRHNDVERAGACSIRVAKDRLAAAAEFDALTHSPRRIKQALHAFAINDGRFLKNAKNSLNGLRFGLASAADQIQVVCALNGPANMLNYSDYVWQKYRIGEWVKEKRPQDRRARRPQYFLSEQGRPVHGVRLRRPQQPGLRLSRTPPFRDLQARGVRFLSCHSSIEEAARALIKMNNLTAQPEEVVKDLQAHILPGVILVPALAAALALLQSDGHYSYMAVG